MTVEQVEATIRAQVQAAKANGWTIACGLYFVGGDVSATGQNTCCPVAAVVIANLPELSRKGLIAPTAAASLGITTRDVADITAGVDGICADTAQTDTPMLRLGQR